MPAYNSFNEDMRARFGCKVYKLSLDGGMTCPNRDGSIGTRGCSFCAADGSGAFAAKRVEDIDAQIASAKALVEKKNRGGKYIAYFQSYTNTYAPLDYLNALFSSVLFRDDICGLSVATRPDCLGDDVIALLAGLNKIKPVWTELGLQTIHEKTAQNIRRGYKLPVFDDAVKRLDEAGIESVAHIILGLPGESEEMMLSTVSYVAHSPVRGIKLQLLHILRGTDMAEDYLQGKFAVLSENDYIRILGNTVELLRPDMVVHRLTGDGAKKDLIAPLWSADKKRVLNDINASFAARGIRQGAKWKP